ncbi:MAG TPA: hypothetical protein VGM67_01480 [Gemmatimonadaceae bacterium]|jgi:hypothetical protein
MSIVIPSERSERGICSIANYKKRYIRFLAALGMTAIAASLPAQTPPPVRPIGRVERVSSDSTTASIASAVSLPGGRVLFNDRVGRRLVLLDSTMTHETIVADGTAGTGEAYGPRPGTLIQYRGDTAMLIDQSSLSMFVISPDGAIARIVAVPRPDDVSFMIAGTGLDARGRFVYLNTLGGEQGAVMLGVGDAVFQDGKPTALARFNVHSESVALVEIDPTTRVVDTLTPLSYGKLTRKLVTDSKGGLTAIETTPDALPLIDKWTVMADGTVAVLRVRDYHFDWLGADGTWTSSPKMPYDWQHLDDARKQALIDSSTKRWKGQYDQIMNGGGRGATGLAPLLAMQQALTDLPDYLPPVTQFPGALQADADGNLWIRTTIMVNGQPVYDVANRRGELIERIQLPPFRTIAGFGPGVVYMAVKGTDGFVHLERARIK